jgi:hypothetical protein
METIGVNITENSEVTRHNSELVDMVVDTTTVNLTASEGDTKMWPEVGTHPIKTEGRKQTSQSTPSTTRPHRRGHNGGLGATSRQTGEWRAT